MMNLNELQHDALIEIFNIGSGRAASAMSGIVGEEVQMSVPALSFVSRAEAGTRLCDPGTKRICGISQHYEGAFKTEAILVFPEEQSLEIVRLMVGEALSMSELTEMEQEAMSEIGNIILNSCVGTLANIFGRELHGSLPSYHVGTGDEILSTSGATAEAVVLLLHIDFTLERHQIRGYVAFMLDVTAIHDLQVHVDEYLLRMVG